MKTLITLVLGMIFILTSCHKDEIPQPSTQHTTTGITCTPSEDSLMGKWFVKQTSMYHADTLLPFSVANYNNAQQYIQFTSELDSTVQATYPGAKISTWSPMGTSQVVNWTARLCTIKAPASTPTYRISYMANDSLILDYGFSADSSQFNRYSLHR